MIVEHFRDGKADDIYRRFAQCGRMMPDGLQYVDSWVSSDLRTCYQLMETEDFDLFAKWIRHWEDLIEFEIVPILTSAEARDRIVGKS